MDFFFPKNKATISTEWRGSQPIWPQVILALRGGKNEQRIFGAAGRMKSEIVSYLSRPTIAIVEKQKF